MGGRARGFTLFELLIVLAVVNILAMILLPTLARTREAARRMSCMTNLAQLGMAMRIYADENNGELPWSGGNDNAMCLETLRYQTHLTGRVFICPSDAGTSDDDLLDPETGFPLDFSQMGSRDPFFLLRASYDYLGAYTAAPITLPPPTRAAPRIPIMWDLGSEYQEGFNHVPGGSNVLWLDGSVDFMRAEEFYDVNFPAYPAGIGDFRSPTDVYWEMFPPEDRYPW